LVHRLPHRLHVPGALLYRRRAHQPGRAGPAGRADRRAAVLRAPATALERSDPMNVVLLVVDSLRARSLDARQDGRPQTPFLDGLAAESVCFRRAFATECWTLPTHTSIFTGLLPSEHRAHFQHLGYEEDAPTLAERLAAAGYHTEVVTRNSIF